MDNFLREYFMMDKTEDVVKGLERVASSLEKTSGYQGWTDWETWQVSLWVNNEEPSYRMMLRGKPYSPQKAEDFVRDLYPEGTPDMDSVSDLDKVNWKEIADAFNED